MTKFVSISNFLTLPEWLEEVKFKERMSQADTEIWTELGKKDQLEDVFLQVINAVMKV